MGLGMEGEEEEEEEEEGGRRGERREWEGEEGEEAADVDSTNRAAILDLIRFWCVCVRVYVCV